MPPASCGSDVAVVGISGDVLGVPVPKFDWSDYATARSDLGRSQVGGMTWRMASMVACGAILGLGACGSSAAKPLATAPATTAPTTPVATNAPSAGPTSAPPAATPPAETAADASTPPSADGSVTGAADQGAMMVVSGFIADTLTQMPLTTGKCHTFGTAWIAGFQYNGSDGAAYAVQITLPLGTTTFPSTGNESVSFSDFYNDPTQFWVAGDQKSTPTAAGTATFDGAQGTVDLDMIPQPASPALAPIHLEGSFVC